MVQDRDWVGRTEKKPTPSKMDMALMQRGVAVPMGNALEQAFTESFRALAVAKRWSSDIEEIYAIHAKVGEALDGSPQLKLAGLSAMVALNLNFCASKCGGQYDAAETPNELCFKGTDEKALFKNVNSCLENLGCKHFCVDVEAVRRDNSGIGAIV